MAVTTPEEVETRVCKRCHEQLPLTSFVRATAKAASGYLHTCKRCFNAYKRERDAAKRTAGIHVSTTLERTELAAKREALGWRYVEQAPASPELAFLSDMLAEDRRAGWNFDAVYDENVRVALTVIDKPRDRELAAEILRWARPHFEAGWRRDDVCRLDPGLIAAFAA